ncbi:MAG: glycosyltransferase family 1 protein [Candidatus Moraniibacteriota bacterium]
MRIGIDIRSLAAGRRTGVEEYTIGLLQELFRQGREHTYVLFFNAWGQVGADLTWAEGFSNVSIRRFRIPNKLLNLSLWYCNRPRLDRLIGGVDVFFMPNLNFAAVSREVKLIVTAHDLSFEFFPELFSWKQRLWHFAVNFRSLLRRADTIVAVSASTADDLVTRYGISAAKVQVIHSGIDARFVPMDRNDLSLLAVQERYHLPYKFILYLGTIEPRKNLGALLSAFEAFHREAVGEEMSRYELVLAGRPGWSYTELFQSIDQSPVRDKIRLIGYVEDADKPALYNLASVFVYPSFYEGFGFPPLEALACGVPVIASHSASLPEVIGEAGVLIDPYRPDEILQAFRGVLGDKQYQAKLRERALARRSDFTWERSGRAFLDLLDQLRSL